MKAAIYVFSYNRPEHLQNCIQSLVTLGVTEPVFVIDDLSDNEGVRQILEELPTGFSHLPVQKVSNHKNYGGLYSNMNLALLHANGLGCEYAIFIQDDTQFLRKVLAEDYLRFDKFFQENSNSFEILIGFEKRRHISSKDRYEISNTSNFRFRLEGHQGHRGFCDVGLFYVSRAIKEYGVFEIGEAENENRALALGFKLAIYSAPFMMWLPFPTAVRSRQVSKLILLADWLSGAGCYPIDLLTNTQVSKILDTEHDAAPRYAEDWLVADGVDKAQDWSTEGAFANLVVFGGWRRNLAFFLGYLYVSLRRLKKYFR